MNKKILPIILVVAVTFFSFLALSPSANAEDCKGKTGTEYQDCMSKSGNYDSSKNDSGAIFDGRDADACQGFLGLTSWDCGVHIKDEDSLKGGIWQIVANVATDLTVIAAYLVLGYVIYGGYLYIFSAGDPGKVAGGKKTLTHAFIGLAIVMSAYVIMNAIRIALLGSSGVFANCATKQCVDTAGSLVTNAVQWVIGIAGTVAVIFVVYGGISYATSAGDPGKLQKAKQTIIYALIGLAIVGLAEMITAFVSGMIKDANNQNTNTSTNMNQLISPKENHEKQIS